MSIKKLFVISLSIIGLCGCTSNKNNNDEPVFTLPEEKKIVYDELIESTLNSFYWRYDEDSINYSKGTIPDDEEILLCSSQSGYNMNFKKGSDCIIATTNLLYYNRENAGTVYFYLDNNDVNGLYYTSANSDIPCSMNIRNAYFTDTPFENVETDNVDEGYIVTPLSTFKADGILDSTTVDGSSYTAFSEGNKIIINKSDFNTPIQTVKTIDYTSENLVPISLTFINGTTEMAILYGTETFPEDGNKPIIVPQKILFFDNSFKPSETNIIAENNDIYSVGYDDGFLILARNRSIDYYPISGLTIGPKQSSYHIGKSMIGMDITDLDADGIKEYIFTDGMDLFVYQKTSPIFKCIWSTHLSIESFGKYICTGDLNRDGIKEIYIYDSAGTTTRYELGEKGIYTDNKNIEYGQRYYVSDFNGDGESDYIYVSEADVNQKEVRIISP